MLACCRLRKAAFAGARAGDGQALATRPGGMSAQSEMQPVAILINQMVDSLCFHIRLNLLTNLKRIAKSVHDEVCRQPAHMRGSRGAATGCVDRRTAVAG